MTVQAWLPNTIQSQMVLAETTGNCASGTFIELLQNMPLDARFEYIQHPEKEALDFHLKALYNTVSPVTNSTGSTSSNVKAR